MDIHHEEATSKRLDLFDQRIERLEAERAIAQTMYYYVDACDRLKQAERISSFFTEDGVWEGCGNFSEFGQTRGRDAIREMFIENPKILPFTCHYLCNPIIGVSMDMQNGWGRWQTLEAATYRGSTQVWIAAIYDNDFVKTEGSWLISHLRFTDIFVVPYDEGWVSARYVSPLTMMKQSKLPNREGPVS